MAKQRTLSEDEQKARAKRKGLTRREFNAQHSKFVNKPPKTSAGDFEVVAIFDGNPAPQTAPFPNESAALARFERLLTNPNVMDLRVIQNKVVTIPERNVSELRRVALYTFQRGGNQEFANSKTEILWRQRGSNGSTFSEKHIWQSPKLQKAAVNGELEVAKWLVHGGQAWWERRA